MAAPSMLLRKQRSGCGGGSCCRIQQGLDATTASGDLYGRVSYFHAGGIDRPLLITKDGVESVVPRETWRGQFHAGTSPTTGLVRDCQQGGQTNCLLIAWPGWRTTARHAWGGEESPDIDVWYGGLVNGMRDASGQMYMRNRYYDPATGQFTQTDPIGLAGGLNAYGFAAGDPVSYKDAYGTCAEDDAAQDSTRALNAAEAERLRCIVQSYSAPELRTEQLAMIDAGEVGIGNYRIGEIDAYQSGRNVWFTGDGTPDGFSSVAVYNEFSLAKIFGHEVRHRHQEMLTRATMGLVIPPRIPLGVWFESDARDFERRAVVGPDPGPFGHGALGWDGVLRCPPF